MFCPDCGSGLVENARFCYRCGYRLPDEVLESLQTARQEPGPSDRSSGDRNGSGDEATTTEPDRGSVARVAHPAATRWNLRSVAWRLILGVFLLFLIALAASFLHDALRIESRQQPLFFCIGLLAVGLSAVVFNHLIRRGTEGPFDRVFSWLTAKEINKIAWTVAPFSLLAFFITAAGDLRFHFSDEAAAAAFSRRGATLTNSGRVLFTQSPDGNTHAAWITPGLVRALRQRGTSVNAGGSNDNPLPSALTPGLARELRQRGTSVEYPLPGLLPLLLLLAVGVHVWRSGGKGWELENRARRQFLLTFGVIQLYALGWSVSGAAGMFFRDMTLHSGWLLHICIFVVLSVLFLGAVYWLLEEGSSGAAAGWLALFFVVHLGSFAGSYALSSASPGSPVLWWTTAYLFVASFGWTGSAADY